MIYKQHASGPFLTIALLFLFHDIAEYPHICSQSADRGRCAMLRFSPLQSAQFQDSWKTVKGVL